MYKDTRIGWFGRTAESRAEGNQRLGIDGSTARVRYAWLLDRVEDRSPVANFMTISYCCTTSATEQEMKEPLPTQITYTGSGDEPGQRSVTFRYRDGDRRVRQISGLAIVSSQVVDRIEASGPTAGVIRSYRFGYERPTGTGVPGILGAEDGIHVTGPRARRGGLAGPPGYPSAP